MTVRFHFSDQSFIGVGGDRIGGKFPVLRKITDGDGAEIDPDVYMPKDRSPDGSFVVEIADPTIAEMGLRAMLPLFGIDPTLPPADIEAQLRASALTIRCNQGFQL